MARYYTNINQKPTVASINSITEYYLTTGKDRVEYETTGWRNSIVPTSSGAPYLWNYKKIVFADGTSEKTQPTILHRYSNGRNVNSITNYYLASSKRSGVKISDTGWGTNIPQISAYKPYLWKYTTEKYTDGLNQINSPFLYETYGTTGREVMLMVGGEIVPDPSSFEYGLSDVSADESGRTEDTLMHKNRVGQKRTLSLQWNGKSWQEASPLLQTFDPEYIYVYYPDAKSGCYEVREFYTGDKKAPIKIWFVGKKIMEQVSFDVIER